MILYLVPLIRDVLQTIIDEPDAVGWILQVI